MIVSYSVFWWAIRQGVCFLVIGWEGAFLLQKNFGGGFVVAVVFGILHER